MIRWPWSERVEEAKARAEAAQALVEDAQAGVEHAARQAERVESQWDFIHAQLFRLRVHTAENGFTEKIHRVARGGQT